MHYFIFLMLVFRFPGLLGVIVGLVVSFCVPFFCFWIFISNLGYFVLFLFNSYLIISITMQEQTLSVFNWPLER